MCYCECEAEGGNAVSKDDLKVAVVEDLCDKGGDKVGVSVVEVGWLKLLRKSCWRTRAVRPRPRDVTRCPIPKLATRFIHQ